MHICFIDACASTSAKESTSSETTATDYEGKITLFIIIVNHILVIHRNC